MSEKKVYPIAHSQVRSDTRDEVKALLTSYRNILVLDLVLVLEKGHGSRQTLEDEIEGEFEGDWFAPQRRTTV
jgi:hypothetical protein